MAGTLPQVTDTNFAAEVLEAEGHVLVDFWAPWCGPCRVVAPVLEDIQSEREDIKIVKLNTDENPETSAKYQVLSIPTMILFKDGQPVNTTIGAYPKRKLEQELAPFIGSPPTAAAEAPGATAEAPSA
jgi:thioredoxin 1